LAQITDLFPIQKRGTIVILEIPSDSINSVQIRIGDELKLRKDGIFIRKFFVDGIDQLAPIRKPGTLPILIRHDEKAETLLEIGLEIWQVES
jgi:hypothetical protein